MTILWLVAFLITSMTVMGLLINFIMYNTGVFMGRQRIGRKVFWSAFVTERLDVKYVGGILTSVPMVFFIGIFDLASWLVGKLLGRPKQRAA